MPKVQAAELDLQIKTRAERGHTTRFRKFLYRLCRKKGMEIFPRGYNCYGHGLVTVSEVKQVAGITLVKCATCTGCGEPANRRRKVPLQPGCGMIKNTWVPVETPSNAMESTKGTPVRLMRSRNL